MSSLPIPIGPFVRPGDFARHVRNFGAVGDGVTDDTAAIQACINAVSAAGGGIVQFGPLKYVCAGLQLPSYVTLRGHSPKYYPAYPSTGNGTTLQQAAGGGHVVTLAATYPTKVLNPGIQDLVIRGAGAAVSGRGIHWPAAQYFGMISQVAVTNFADEGVYIGGTACIFRDSIVTSCVLNFASLAFFKAAVFIAGSEHWITNVEAQTSSFQGAASGTLNTVTSSNRYCVAWFVSGTGCWFHGCVGELSDSGWVLWGENGVGAFGTDEKAYGATGNAQWTACRADRNAAEGWRILNWARNNRFTSCGSLSNGGSNGAGDGAYDAWVEGDGSVTSYESNLYLGCTAESGLDSFAPYKYRNAFWSGTGNTPMLERSQYLGCRAVLNGAVSTQAYTGQLFRQHSSANGDDADPAGSCPTALNFAVAANAATTPSVANLATLVLANSGATSITDFTGAANGQQLVVYTANANSTIVHGSTIKLLRGASVTPGANDVLTFLHYKGVWYERRSGQLSGGALALTSGTAVLLGGDSGFANYVALKFGGTGAISTTTYHFMGGAADPSLYINTASGGNIYVRINNATKLTLDASKFTFAVPILLPAGTAAAATAPLKLVSGVNLTTPENGAFEYDGTSLYFTTGGTRKTVTLL